MTARRPWRPGQMSSKRAKNEVEHRIWRTRDAEFRWHKTRANPLGDARNQGDWVGTSTDVHEMRGLQERQKVLLAELQHRTRNLLAVVQSVARQTRRTTG